MDALPCLQCSTPASFEETCFLDWGKKDGTVEGFRVSACDAHRQAVRERLVRIFGRQPNPLVGGSLIHVVPAEQHWDLVLWSNVKDFRSWDKAGKIVANTQFADGAFRPIFGNIRTAVRQDWRGWGDDRRPHPKYELPPRETAEATRPHLEQFIKRWIQKLPQDWTPRYEARFPI